MPTYEYECQNGHIVDRFGNITEDQPKEIECPDGHGKAKRIISIPQFQAFTPFVDIHLTGKPQEIRTREQHKKAMDAAGVRHMDSSEYPERVGWGRTGRLTFETGANPIGPQPTTSKSEPAASSPTP